MGMGQPFAVNYFSYFTARYCSQSDGMFWCKSLIKCILWIELKLQIFIDEFLSCMYAFQITTKFTFRKNRRNYDLELLPT